MSKREGRKVPGKKNMISVTVHLPEEYVKVLDALVKKKFYPNRAEAIRMAVRDFIQSESYLVSRS